MAIGTVGLRNDPPPRLVESPVDGVLQLVASNVGESDCDFWLVGELISDAYAMHETLLSRSCQADVDVVGTVLADEVADSGGTAPRWFFSDDLVPFWVLGTTCTSLIGRSCTSS